MAVTQRQFVAPRLLPYTGSLANDGVKTVKIVPMPAISAQKKTCGTDPQWLP